jgi:hypothetical protein
VSQFIIALPSLIGFLLFLFAPFFFSVQVEFRIRRNAWHLHVLAYSNRRISTLDTFRMSATRL